MSDSDTEIKEILKQYKEYLETEEAKEHLQTMEKEKLEVQELMDKLSQLDRKSPEFTELVLYGLLPYSNTKVAKRVSLFPAFMNIRIFFKEYNYSDEEWNLIANRIYDLCVKFKENPENLSDYIDDFTKDKYSRRLQCGSITPILFCINDNYPIINNRAIKTFRRIKLIFGEKEKLSQKLQNYVENIEKIKRLVEQLDLDILNNHDYQDLFFYWYDSKILTAEKKSVKDESEESEEEPEEKIKIEGINYTDFIEDIDLSDISKFSPHSLRNPERIKVRDVISNSDKTYWVLPHFQRYFSWKKEHIRGFLKAIFNDYYIGAFLLWDTEKDPEVDIQTIKGVNKDEINPNSIILDGQQRITSLYYSIKAPYILGFSNKKAWKDTKIYGQHPIYFYINFKNFLENDKNNELIETRSKQINREDCFKRMLFPLYELEKYNEWLFEFEKFLRNNSINHEKILEIREIIRKKLSHMWEGFEIPYIALPKTIDINQVTDIFEGINSTGIKLTVFDLLIARFYKKDISLKQLWDDTKEEFEIIDRYSRTIEKIPIYILQAISLLYEKSNSCKRKDILNIYKNIDYDSTERSFDDDWNDTVDYMDLALKKLENMRDGFGVKDEKQLPFAPMIPVLIALLKEIDKREDKSQCYVKLNKWYWSAIFTLAYSSAADSQMTTDFREVKKWFDNDSEIPGVVTQLHRELLTIDFKNIKAKSSARYRGIMSLIALQGAKDFDTLQNLENSRENDDHHIFPDKCGIKSKYINSVLNKTWLSSKTNKKISNNKPSLYMKNFINEKGKPEFIKILKTHLITEKLFDLLMEDKFEEFLSDREENIINKIKEMVGIDETETKKTLISPANPFTNRLIFINTLKSCQEYIYWVDKYFSTKGLELLAESVSNKIKEIKIIMSIDKVDENFRSLFKDFKKEIGNKGIACDLKVITDSKIKSSIHDRFIITKYDSYNIPSPDIIARGQLSEISKSGNKEELKKEFNELWNKSKDIIQEWNDIKDKIKE